MTIIIPCKEIPRKAANAREDTDEIEDQEQRQNLNTEFGIEFNQYQPSKFGNYWPINFQSTNPKTTI